jgi:hypothetical protein
LNFAGPTIWGEAIGKREGNIYIPHDAYYFTEVGQENPKTTYVPAASGYTVVHIKKVFKGQLKYRTPHLYDGTWYYRWYNLFSIELVKTPRDGWYDDARYDGVSADGQRATFQYGPVETPGKRTQGGMRGWPGEEWKKLPVGVQVE